MYESPEKINLALYFGSKVVDKSGQFIFKPFPTYQHMQLEAFAFAFKYNFFEEYQYEVGEYMPYSARVEQGIRDNFIYNPVFNNYESKEPIPWDFNEWLGVNKSYKTELSEIRELCEMYSPQELYLIWFEHLKPFIKNLRKDYSDVNVYRNQINRTLKGMLYDWDNKRILNEKYERLTSMFEKLL